VPFGFCVVSDSQLIGVEISVPMGKLTRYILLLFSFVSIWRFGTLQALSQSTSSAKRDSAEARQSVVDASISIDPNKIIEILQREPGLTYTIKKLLADAALQEGRLLDDTSFPDSTLYYLVQTDDNIRAMVTGELIKRKYIAVHPTEQEATNEAQRLRQRESELAKTARDRDQNENPLYSVSDPERRIKPSANCDPSGNGPDDPCPPPPRDPNSRPGFTRELNAEPPISPTPIQAAELPTLFARSGVPTGTRDNGSILGPVPQPAPSSGWAMPNASPNMSKTTRTSGDRGEAKAAEDELVLRRKSSPYASVPSLIDLYSQVERRYDNIGRFGASLFAGYSDALKEQLPIDMPAGPDYVVGPGDGLNVEIWGGGAAQRVQRVVDREGRLSLPDVGVVEVAGKSLAQVQQLVQTTLRRDFRDVQADISLARLRTVRVYVVGDVRNPGAYDVSSLSTPLNAVLAAGGPTNQGSFRTFKHYRGKQLIQEIDSYDLILNGVRSDIRPLQSGDTVLIPPVGSEVTIEGMVRRPAIYELRGEKDLFQALALAGGVLPTGTLRHVVVERIQAHQTRTMLSLDIPDSADDPATTKSLQGFAVQGGDKIRISPILPYSEKTVFLDGHVFRPGKYPYREGMKVADLIRNYDDLLPEPARQYAEIIRLNPPDFRPVILSFNLNSGFDKIEGQSPSLQPFDTVRIFSRFDFEDSPTVLVHGEVRHPGPHQTNGDLTLRDAIYLAGGLTPDADLGDAQVFRIYQGKAEFFDVNLSRALAGDATANLHLLPRDRVFVHKSLIKVDPPSVSIRGEVATPGRFPLAPGMTVSQLVRVAGGLKRGAYTGQADLQRYDLDGSKPIAGTHQQIDLAAVLSGPSDITLKDGDVLTIRQLNGFEDIGSSVSVRGEVMYAGTYGISSGERLSSVLRRAGGFGPLAYPYAVVFTRENIRLLEEKNRAELVQRLQQEVTAGKNISDSQVAQSQAVLLQQSEAIHRLQSAPALGRQVIRISAEISKWANTDADIVLQKGDAIIVPRKPNFVMVTGMVYNPNALTYAPGKNVKWYLRQAGGVTELGREKKTFVIRADGSIVSSPSRLFSGGVMDYTLRAGDTIVVPERLVGSQALKNFSEMATLVSSLFVAARIAISF
jgi:protein involved in polysaccharide export with SLBB domain